MKNKKNKKITSNNPTPNVKIVIEYIEHSQQRYATVGDWYFDLDNVLHICVSKMSDERYCLLVAVHELIETILCGHSGITQETVDDFDTNYELHRPPNDFSEPGDNSKAPYRKEHGIAMGVERILAAALDVDWINYSTEINNL